MKNTTTALFAFVLTLFTLGAVSCASRPPIKENSHTYSKRIHHGAYLLLVEAKTPWYGFDFIVRSAFKKAIPEYQGAKGLIRKSFIIGRNSRYGGLYVWSSRQELESFYTEEKIQGIEKKRGQRPEINLFKMIQYRDFPLGLPAEATNSKQWNGDYTLSVEDLKLTQSSELEAKRSFELSNQSAGMISHFLVQNDQGNFYQIKLWVSEDLMQKGLDQKSKAKTFDAPILIEGL